MKAKDLLLKLIKKSLKRNNGFLRISDGMHLYDQDGIIEEQKCWPDDDEAKNYDFSTCSFWVVTDNGHIDGFTSIAEVIEEKLTMRS